MTEQEAKKLRCCGPDSKNTGTSNIDDVNQAAGIGIAVPLIYYCSGSECAGWIKTSKPARSGERIIDYIEGGYCCYRRDICGD